MPRKHEDREPTWPQYLRLFHGDDFAILEAQIDYEWLALYHLCGDNGRLAISEIQIVPAPRTKVQQRAHEHAIRTRAGRPGHKGPPRLPSTALRNVLAEDALKAARFAAAHLPATRAGITVESLASGVREKRRHKAPYEYAAVCALYVEVVRSGGRGNEDVARRLGDGYDAAYVRRIVDYGRNKLGFLPPTSKGRQAAEDVALTPEARRVLQAGPPEGYSGPLA